MQDGDLYEIYAVKYGEVADRAMSENMIGGDPHDMSGQLDFYVWAVVGRSRTFIVDTGFNHETAAARNRKLQRLPKEGLALVGVDAGAVRDVIVTHMHYDHAGTLSDFPNARFHLQAQEMEYATGPCMCHEVIKAPYDVEDVCTMVRKLYAGELTFHDGDAQLAPGISVHHIGGHAKGLMSVRVETRRGPVVLASDAAHFYANLEQRRPFPIVYNVADLLAGFDRLEALAGAPDRVVPGHDPRVLHRYPAASDELKGIAARLDTEPA